MHTPSPAELLSLWESAPGQPPALRALRLLLLVHPDTSLDELESLPIGQRDARLLQVQGALFGGWIEGLVNCPHCNQVNELSFNASDLMLPPSPAKAAARYELDAAPFRVQFRLPNSQDLVAAACQPNVDAARRAVLEHCILAATCDEVDLAFDQLPPEVLEAVTAQMAHLDPQSEMQLALVCSACSHNWLAEFDILEHVWSRLDVWAKRTLRDVHDLAAAYHWSEADILSLSPVRRQHYLEIIGA